VTPTSKTAKTDLLLRQTRIHFPRLEEVKVRITPIEKGGSDRKFYRVKCSPEQTIILVKYNLEREENRHYVEIAEFLAAHKIRAPKIYFHDAAEGLIWIEDLGKTDLWSYREESWIVRRAFYESALGEVVKLHCLPGTAIDSIRKNLPAEFDAALYRWEQNYFFENCLGRFFGMPAEELSDLASLGSLGQIADELAARPRVLVHRDFQSQNLIVRNGQAHLIDPWLFVNHAQDGVLDGSHVLGDDDVDAIASRDQEVKASNAVDLEGDSLLARLQLGFDVVGGPDQAGLFSGDLLTGNH
jgi:hypothetical protein